MSIDLAKKRKILKERVRLGKLNNNAFERAKAESQLELLDEIEGKNQPEPVAETVTQDTVDEFVDTWADYDDLSVNDLKKGIAECEDRSVLNNLLGYEKANKNRTTAIAAIEERIEELNEDN